MSSSTVLVKDEPVSDWEGSPPTPKSNRLQMDKRAGGPPGVRIQKAKRTSRAV